jgi:hypothetical protein
MATPTQSYTFRVSGLWNTRHEVTDNDGPIGVLLIRRNRWGRIDEGEFRPEKGEVLRIRREPGLLRGQFSFWTDAREWLGSSLRPSVWRREIQLSTGSKPLRMLASPGFGRGWRISAPRTGEVAALDWSAFGRGARLDVGRRADLEVLIFAYFLSTLAGLESWLPGPQSAASQAAPAAG